MPPWASPGAVFGPKHPVTAIHLATPPPGYLYFLLQTFPNAVAVQFLFDRNDCSCTCRDVSLGRVRLSVRGDEPQLSGVWGQAAAAQQLGFLGKQTTSTSPVLEGTNATPGVKDKGSLHTLHYFTFTVTIKMLEQKVF